jgi:Flp pilus assembly protein TadG
VKEVIIMLCCTHRRKRTCARPRGAAAVEFALLLPFLAFLFVIAVDWARIFYYSITVTNCARNGALYMSQQQSAKTTTSPYTDSGYVNLYVNSTNPVSDAALADAPNLQPAPTVTSTTGSDSYGSYVEVTVSYQFKTVTNFSVGQFSVPSNNNVTRTVRMYVPPESPN